MQSVFYSKRVFERATMSVEMVYERLRGWNSGWGLLVINLNKSPLQSGGGSGVKTLFYLCGAPNQPFLERSRGTFHCHCCRGHCFCCLLYCSTHTHVKLYESFNIARSGNRGQLKLRLIPLRVFLLL